MSARFCLKEPGQLENDIVLGTSSYKNGYKATASRTKTDAGLGWLKGDGDPQIVRAYYLDLPATERAAARARVIRETAGVLTGHALGLDGAEEPRSFAADVLAVSATARGCGPRRSLPGSQSASRRATPTSPPPPPRASCARSP